MGRRIPRRGFDITDERMFWETDDELLPAPAPTPAPMPARRVASQPRERQAAAEVQPTPAPTADPDVSGRLRELSAAITPWGVEPEWTTRSTHPRRSAVTPTALAGAAAAVAVVVAAGTLALGGSSAVGTSHPSRHVTVSAQGRRMPIVLTGYLTPSPHFPHVAGGKTRPGSHRRSKPSHGRRPAASRHRVRRRAAARSEVELRPAHRVVRHRHAPAIPSAPARAVAPLAAPATSEPSGGSTGTATATSPPAPVSHGAPSAAPSEFGFEQ